jgi:lysophospholipase L1-like esterase
MRARVVRALRLAAGGAALCLSQYALAACAAAVAPSASPVSSSAKAAAQPSAAAPPPTVMIVGDSITQGLEGDVTWRYDLAKVEAAAVPGFTYVGPWSGTYALPARLPAGWPTVPAPPVYDGAYASGETFPHGGDSRHDARWGMTMADGASSIQAAVHQYHPSYLLVMLGFDDLAWEGQSPASVLAQVQNFVSAAQAASPSIRILFSNIVQRAPLRTAPTLPATISDYNQELAGTLASLSTDQSQVDLVDVAGSYHYASGTYDGLHPNNIGEWMIANAFANALAKDFGFGRGSTYLPSSQHLVRISQPSAPTLTADAAGIYASWPHVFGAAGYYLEVADITAGQTLGTRTELPAAIVADGWQLTMLVPGHQYEVAVQAMRGYQETPFSAPTTATAPSTPAR